MFSLIWEPLLGATVGTEKGYAKQVGKNEIAGFMP